MRRKLALAALLIGLLLSLIPAAAFSETFDASNYTECANENGTCTFEGTRVVAYGANGHYAFGVFTSITPCTNGVFGDPIGGTAKKSYYKNGDKTPPVTSDDAPTIWVNHAVTVNLSATDGLAGSGVAATYYNLDDNGEQSGTTIAVSTEGIHTILYWSVDQAGKVEAPRTTTVKIDKTAPWTTSAASPGWANATVTVTFSTYDYGSEVASTFYTVDDGVPQTGTSVTIAAIGDHSLEYWSTDHAGNIESKHRTTVRVKPLPLDSAGQFHLVDALHVIQQGTLEEKDLNGDGLFNRDDVIIMLQSITPVSMFLPG
ncbi:OmpL47-type beta-barrel domain-containing protein [Paenibacillus cymbidii]|uniref:OmpL47-type beta-barrel domain-containing protein n=1 Tax=Paenibacillus cymbidii TaxID=1639034 RepID=UPI001080D0BB|nr:hypothetical protein [Paenibacillus cymbidii]